MGCFTSKKVSVVSLIVESTQSQTRGLGTKPKTKDSEDQLTSSLKTLRKSILTEKAQFDPSYELLCTIVRKIIDHYDEEKYKRIKKENKKFQEFLGKYSGSEQVMKLLGFKDQGQEWVYVESLGKSYSQMKILDLSIAYKKL